MLSFDSKFKIHNKWYTIWYTWTKLTSSLPVLKFQAFGFENMFKDIYIWGTHLTFISSSKTKVFRNFVAWPSFVSKKPYFTCRKRNNALLTTCKNNNLFIILTLEENILNYGRSNEPHQNNIQKKYLGKIFKANKCMIYDRKESVRIFK